MSFMSLLAKLGLVRAYSASQIDDAETENILRDNQLAMQRFQSSNDRFIEPQGKLRQSIQTAKDASASVDKPVDPMAQFVREMRSFHPLSRRH